MIILDMNNLINILKNGLQIFLFSFKQISIWRLLAQFDIKAKYSRTYLGPFWNTFSLGIFISILCVVWSKVLNQDINIYILHFSTGYVFWVWISNHINESGTCLINQSHTIKQINLPVFVYIFRMFFKNILILLHNFLIIFIVFFVTKNHLTLYSLLFFIGFFLVVINLFFLGSLISIITIRYHDLNQFVALCTQVAFFCTPIIWNKSLLTDNYIFLQINPFFHWIEILREPLMNHVPNVENYLFSLFSAAALFLMSIYFYGRYNKRLVFWI